MSLLLLFGGEGSPPPSVIGDNDGDLHLGTIQQISYGMIMDGGIAGL